MKQRELICATLGLACVIGLIGCGPKQETGQQNPGPAGPNGSAASGHGVPSQTPEDRLKDQLSKSLADAKEPYPEGARILSVTLKGDLVTLDLSSEFSKVENLGTQGESDALMALRKVLAQDTSINKMRVTIEGKLFATEHGGEWDAIPVRDDSGAGRT